MASNRRRTPTGHLIGMSVVPALALALAMTGVGSLGIPQAQAADVPSDSGSVQASTSSSADAEILTPISRDVPNSDGTRTLTVSARPVRVHTEKGWVPVDPTLTRNDDGTWSTTATPSRVVLSGGGEKLLAVLDNGGTRMRLDWPTELPTPTVSGASATYPEVLPGVDLVATTNEGGGLSHVLVVKTPQAAASPRLAELHVTCETTGGDLSADAAGNLTVRTGPDGREVFTAPAPLMWDSGTGTRTSPTASSTATASPTVTSTTAAAALKTAAKTASKSTLKKSSTTAALDAGTDPDQTPTQSPAANSSTGTPVPSTVAEPGPGARVAPVGVHLDGNRLTLTPNQDLLTAPDTTWPVYIDPSWNASSAASRRNAWTFVSSAFPNQSFYNTDDVGRVGYQGWQTPYSTTRTFYRMTVPTAIHGRNVLSATLQTSVTWSSDPDEYQVDVYHTGAIAKTTTWNQQPTRGAKITSRKVTANWSGTVRPSPRQAEFDIVSLMTKAAAKKWSTVTIGLYSPDEDNKYAFRKFGINPTIAVRYNSVPRVQEAGTSPTTGCNPAKGKEPGKVGRTDVTLRVRAKDPDADQSQIDVTFTVKDPYGTVIKKTVTTVNSNNVARTVLPATSLKDKYRYTWTAVPYDGKNTGKTITCRFAADLSIPDPPVITSTTFPTDDENPTTYPAARTPGTFRFTSKAKNIVSYVYSLNTPPPTTIPTGFAASSGGTLLQADDSGATPVTITPRKAGHNRLYVYSINEVGTPSLTEHLDFVTGPLATPDIAGDLTGDRIPDALTTGTAQRPGLWLSAGTDRKGNTADARQIGQDGLAGDGEGDPSDWNDAALAVADLDGDGSQDVATLRETTDGSTALSLLTGNSNGTVNPVDQGSGVIMLPNLTDVPEELETDADETSTTPSPSAKTPVSPSSAVSSASPKVEQIALVPNKPGSTGDLPDLYVTAGGSLFRVPALPERGEFIDPVELSGPDVDGLNWSKRTITGTAAAGQAVLIIRDTATGTVRQRAWDPTQVDLDGTTGPAPGTSARPFDADTTLLASKGYSASTHPTVTAADLDTDGDADLWAVTPERELLAVTSSGTVLTGVAASSPLGAVGRIQSAYAGKCIDVASGSTATGTAVQLYDCNGTTSQVWNFPGDGTLRFKDRCLDLPPSETYGTPLQIAPCTGSGRQTWDFRPDGTLYNLYNTTTWWCVVVPGGDTSNRTRLESNYCTDTARKQLWELRTDGQGPIRSAHQNICLDSRVKGESDNLATVHTCDQTAAQNWIVFGDGALRVGGDCLDVPGSSTANNTGLQVHTCNGTPAQQWRVGPNHTLINTGSGLCLDIPDTDNNTRARLHTCNGTNAQRWTLP